MADDEQEVLSAIHSNTIYTVGHSNHPLGVFLALLRRHRVEVLIDTRSSPFSRYAPQFNRETLKAAILDAGLKYGFYGRELGGRPENQAFYDAEGHADYAQIAGSQLFQAGLARLVAGSANHRTALLCSEENPSVCHRRLLISRVLFEAGLSVTHIRGDGRLETETESRERETQGRTRQCGLFDDTESMEADTWKSLKPIHPSSHTFFQSASPKAPPPTFSDD